MRLLPAVTTLTLLATPLLAALTGCNHPPAAEGEGEGEGDGGEGENTAGEGEAGEGEGDAGEGEGDAGEGEGDAGEGEGDAGEGEGEGEGDGVSAIPFVFVIAMENKRDTSVYGNANAPYINDFIIPTYATSSNFVDVFSTIIPSEPHYVWMEAGTNRFDDHTFLFDSDPSGNNSTGDGDHLAAQLVGRPAGHTWRSYQEGLDADTTGACPVHSAGFFKPKHDPFVFFTDVTGDPPDPANAECAAHHRAFVPADFAADLAAGDVEQYNFITPNQCNDMHGQSGCANGCTGTSVVDACVAGGDLFLQENVPPIIDFINAHGGVLIIMYDEPEGQHAMPFFIIGPGVKSNYVSPVEVSASSFVKSMDLILGLDINPRVTDVNDFSDFFEPGQFP